MNVKARFALVLAWLVCAPAGMLAAGVPAMSISGPLEGSTLLSRSVEVNGTALGSQVEWQEALKEDFDAGTIENLTNDAAGTLSLDRTVYDTFEGTAVDPGRWTANESNGLSASLSGGRLMLSGSGQADGWASAAELVSTAKVSDRMNGTLLQFMELGTGAYSVIGLYQDDQNFIGVGRGFDFFGLGPGQKAVLVSSVSGCFTMESLGNLTEVAHTFSISYNGSNAVFYMDGSQLQTRAVALAGARCLLRAAVNATNEFVNALWDDVSCLYLTSGRFTSAVQDSLSERPNVTRVAWTATLPAGLSLDVQLRSSNDPGMNGASGWVGVSNGQGSGFPAFKRYLQYALLFDSPSGNGTPVLRDITVKYICDVKQVDVSKDNRATWARASGKEAWNITLDLPDGPWRIWARVTDVAGEMQLATVNISIDTTEPTLSLLINDGAEMAPGNQVNLTLDAYDAFGLASMAIGEDAELSGAVWQPYHGRPTWFLSEGDGPKTVYAMVRDSNGWESPVASASITLDTLPPAGTIRINTGGNFTKTPAVTLYLNATDAVGVSEMLLSNRMDFSGEGWQPYSPVYPWNLAPGNGLRTVFARFRDAAGHMSFPVSATMMLDTVLPEFSFSIENGSAYARSYDVELELCATDNNALGEMLVSGNPQFQGAAWEPWAPARRWTLPAAEGPASLHAKVRDAAENEAPARAASIMVDTVAPLCAVTSLPATTASTSFTVGWNGNDATSGILGYDVQFRQGTGPWTDWQLLVTNTTAVFTGEDGQTYTFRARAHDLAGNAGAYPDNPKTATTIKLPVPGSQPPVVSILTPLASAPYKGTVRFEGTARALAAGRSIVSVQWRVDTGAWLTAAGTDNWSFEWNTAGVSRGAHSLRVRSFDGQNYSAEAERSVRVDSPAAPGGGTDLTPVLLILAVVLVVGAVAGALVLRRRKAAPAAPGPAAPEAAPAEPLKAAAATSAMPAGKAPEEEPAGPAPESEKAPDGEAEKAEPAGQPPEAAPLAAGAAEPSGGAPGETAAEAAAAVPPAAGEAPPVAGGASPPAAEMPSALPPLSSTPRPPLELVRQLDPAQILPVVQALHPSLPGELQFMQPDVITELVVTGERSKGKSGEQLVLIMGRWYFADENKPQFLQRYNW